MNLRLFIETNIRRFREYAFNRSDMLTRLAYLWLYGKDRRKYVSVVEEVTKTHEWIKKIPKEFDIVVGIPRCGLLQAAVISQELGKPLSTPELFAKGILWKTESDASPSTTVFLVDDSFQTGTSLLRAERLLLESNPQLKIIKGVLVAPRDKTDFVDTYYETYDGTTFFEHDMMEHKNLVTDLDGVLSEDFHGDETTMGDAEYRKRIRSMKPYRVPKFRLRTIITSRLEQFRAETEEWLRNHDIEYDELLMRPPNADPASFKCECLKRMRRRPYYFCESDPATAALIHRSIGIKVVCFSNMRIYE